MHPWGTEATGYAAEAFAPVFTFTAVNERVDEWSAGGNAARRNATLIGARIDQALSASRVGTGTSAELRGGAASGGRRAPRVSRSLAVRVTSQ